MNKTLKKIGNVIIDVLIVLIVLISLIIAMLSLTSKSSGIPNILGLTVQTVQSDSMNPEFYKGDVIFGTATDDYAVFEVGDVVSFSSTIGEEDVVKTHEVVRVEEVEGERRYYTQGINREVSQVEDEGFITAVDILAEYNGGKIPGFGNVLDFLRTQLGFFLVIVLPMIIFFIYEAVRVVLNIIAYNKAKARAEAEEALAAKQADTELTDEQKRLIAEEYLKTRDGTVAEEAPAEVMPEISDATTGDSDESEDSSTQKDLVP
ncbi:MAG: signal peptidase I [Oscillospiraceae bacterium]|jgi:signal peptidase|nr:signal peptidase I [Oscillospiraceae bacterium]